MFISQLKRKYVIGKAIPFKDGLHLNKEGGPAAPIPIDDMKDWEISWRQGRPQLLRTPPIHWEQDTEDHRNPHLDLTRDRGGSNTGTLPSDPLAPMEKLKYVNKDERITEENIKAMTYLSRLSFALGMAALTFQDVLTIVKRFFPEIKMQFPKPPTYIWNPPSTKEAPPPPEKGKEGEKGKEEEEAPPEGEEEENTEKLKPQQIKDKLKIKLPQLKWTMRMLDGVEEAELGFADGSTAVFEIGADANHLTITYTAPTRETKPQVEVPDEESDDEEVSDEDWRAK